MPTFRASDTYFDGPSLDASSRGVSLPPAPAPRHHRISRATSSSRPPLAVLMEAVFRAWDDVSYRPPKPLPPPSEESSLEVRRATTLYCGFLAGMPQLRTPHSSR